MKGEVEAEVNHGSEHLDPCLCGFHNMTSRSSFLAYLVIGLLRSFRKISTRVLLMFTMRDREACCFGAACRLLAG